MWGDCCGIRIAWYLMEGSSRYFRWEITRQQKTPDYVYKWEEEVSHVLFDLRNLDEH